MFTFFLFSTTTKERDQRLRVSLFFIRFVKMILELASKVVLVSFYKYTVCSIEFQHLFLIRDLEIKISPPEEESGKGKGEALHFISH